MKYRKIQFTIKKDGTILEEVIHDSVECDSECLDATKPFEEYLGETESREMKENFEHSEQTVINTLGLKL